MNEPAQPPEQWRPLFDKIGVEFGYRPLATRINMDHTRLRRLLLGGGTTHGAVQAVADAFKVSPEKIRELRGEQPLAYEPFTLPDDAGRLNHRERDVIRAMVRVLLDARTGHAVSTTEAAQPDAPTSVNEDEKTSVDGPQQGSVDTGFLGGLHETPVVDPGEDDHKADDLRRGQI